MPEQSSKLQDPELITAQNDYLFRDVDPDEWTFHADGKCWHRQIVVPFDVVNSVNERELDIIPQSVLDGLYAWHQSMNKCPACGVSFGESHLDACNIPTCSITGVQRSMCDCGKCPAVLWRDTDPVIEFAYSNKMLIYHNRMRMLNFDINRADFLYKKALLKKYRI